MKIENTTQPTQLWKIKDLPQGTFFRLVDLTGGFYFRSNTEYIWFRDDGSRPEILSIAYARSDECAILIPHDTITVSLPL